MMEMLENVKFVFKILCNYFQTKLLENGTYITLRLLMSYKYGASILDVSRSHTTTQHSR